MKRSRQKAILTILNQRRITTQEQLRDALLEQGIRVTQATLSRDIAELGLTKDENGYGLPRAGGNAMGGSKGVKILSEAVREVDCAGNIVVVKALTDQDKTKTQLAAEIGTSPQYLSYILYGVRSGEKYLPAIIAALNLDPRKVEKVTAA